MRLFGYYAVHACFNQIKKLLRTSIVIFIVVCGLVGGLIGYGAAVLEDHASEDESYESVYDEEMEDFEDYEDLDYGAILDEEMTDIDLSDEGLSLLQADGSRVVFDYNRLLEAGAALVILVIMFFMIFSADKSGSNIFMMADVNLLFSAPLKPQSVLLFRLLNQMGMLFFASAYLLFQLPNLVINLGLSVGTGLMIIVIWFGALVMGELFQIFLFTFFTTRELLKKFLFPGLCGTVVLLLGCMLAYAKVCHITYLTGAIAFLNLPFTRWIPFLGWLKGLMMYFIEGNVLMTIVMAVLLLVSFAALTYGIWQMKADFYEDALSSAEKKDAQQKDITEGRTAVSRKKKDRSEKLKRDEFAHGWGANVFFHKSMYNRFRFAKFGIFTKTNLTYLAVMAGGLFASNFFTGELNFVFVALALGVFVFYRAIGNPLQEDVEMSFFIMAPSNMWAKLFWSLLAGSTNALLDIAPAMIIGAVITKTSPFVLLAWIFFLLTVDLYSVIAITFISICIPKNVSLVVKQLFLILFIYFGLLPDIALIAIGFVLDHRVTYTCLAGAVNLILGLLFFLMIPAILDPHGRIKPKAKPLPEEVRKAIRKKITWIGFGGFVIIVVTTILQMGLLHIATESFSGFLETSEYGFWMITFLPMYLIAVPLGLLFIRKAPEKTPDFDNGYAPVRWKPLEMIQIFLMCWFLMYTGNIIGSLVNYVISWFVPDTVGNPLETFAGSENVLLKIIFMVILAPCIEEYIFRKQLIARLRPYGEKMAVIVSAVMFGLFHGNFSQFFYATALGLVFGYVYLRSEKLRYSIGLHMIINFIGSVVSVWVVGKFNAELENMDLMLEAIDHGESFKPGFGMILFLCYLGFILVASVAGMVLLVINWQKIYFLEAPQELSTKQAFKSVLLNWGMILFAVSCIVMFVMAIGV